MNDRIDRAIEGLARAVEFAKHYRFEMTDEYRALIEQVEAMPRNQSGADRSGRWLGSVADRKAFFDGISQT